MTSQQYQQKPGVHVRQMDDQVFLADPDTDVLFHLNPVGSAVWRLLEQPTSIDEVTGLLTEAFPDAPAGQISTDVSALYDELLRNGLILEPATL